MKAKEFDERFEAGEDMFPYLDTAKAYKPNAKIKRVNVDFPEWMVSSLDAEASRLGVTRQSVIKFWIADRLEDRALSTSPTDANMTATSC